MVRAGGVVTAGLLATRRTEHATVTGLGRNEIDAYEVGRYLLRPSAERSDTCLGHPTQEGSLPRLETVSCLVSLEFQAGKRFRSPRLTQTPRNSILTAREMPKIWRYMTAGSSAIFMSIPARSLTLVGVR